MNAEIPKDAELKDEHDGVRLYTEHYCPNSHYLVFPCGFIVHGYGFRALTVMRDIRERGAAAVVSDMKGWLGARQRVLREIFERWDKVEQ